MEETPHQPIFKNYVQGQIIAGGNVHIGDITYVVETVFQETILFLELTKSGDQYHAGLSVRTKHLGKAPARFFEKIALDVPPDLLQRAEAFEQSRQPQEKPFRGTDKDATPQHLQEAYLEEWLFKTFFSGETGERCREFVQLLRDRKINDLFLVIASEDDTIRNLPWEMVIPRLFPAADGQAKSHLANTHFTLARTAEISSERFNLQGPTRSGAPLKLLFVTALPENLLETSKLLELEDEARKLIKAVGGLEATGDNRPKMVIEFIDCASLDEIDQALGARHHDIVHISGHGAFRDGQGVLFLEDEKGDVQQVTGKDLGERLSRHHDLKLLLLSACETAVSGQGGMAEQLAKSGIPAVLAMHYAVTDDGAKQFTTEFYKKLADGKPLSLALDAGREVLWQQVTRDRRERPQVQHLAEWFTPALYLNQHIGALVDGSAYDEKTFRRFYPETALRKSDGTRLIGQGFIGRKRYLIQLRKYFLDQRPVCLHAMGGLGKTTLAEAFAENYCRRFEGDVLNFRNKAQLEEQAILERIVNHWKSTTKPSDFRFDEMKAVLENPKMTQIQKLDDILSNCIGSRKIILLFDNFEDVQTDDGDDMHRHIVSNELKDFYRHLLAKAQQYSGLRILFTTRYRISDFDGGLVENLPLEKMGYAEMYRYLNYSDHLRRIPTEHREAVHRRLDGHPRAMTFLEALMFKDRDFAWEQLGEKVDQVEQDIFENLLLEKLWTRLPEPEKDLFLKASVFFSRSPVAALVAASGLEEKILHEKLAALRDWSFCFYDGGKFEVHALTRAWVVQKGLLAEDLRKDVAKKAGDFYRDQPTWDDEAIAIVYYELAEAWEDFAEASLRLASQYSLIGLYKQSSSLRQNVLDRNISQQNNAVALGGLGYNLLATGKYGKALEYFEKSLKMRREIGDRQGEGITLNNISQIYDAQGDYLKALGYLENSLKIRQEIGDSQGEGITLNNIGLIYDAQGEYSKALIYLEQSLTIQQKTGNRQGEGTALGNIGLNYRRRGEYTMALKYYELSLIIAQELGDRKNEGLILNNISQIYVEQGDYRKALNYLEQGLEIQQGIGDRQGEGTTLNNIGQIYEDQGDYLKALIYLEQSFKIRQEIGDLQGEGTALNNLAVIAHKQGNSSKGLNYLEQSLKIQQKIGDISGKATTFHNMGYISFEKENWEHAIGCFLQAYQIFKQIGSPNYKVPEDWLDSVIERIGEEQFKTILAKIQSEAG